MMRWDNLQERQDALELGWAEFRERWPGRTKHGYRSFRRDVRGGKRQLDPSGTDAKHAIPPGVTLGPASMAQVNVPLGGEQTPGKLTIVFGDAHFGDTGLMLGCWEWCRRRVVQIAHKLQPEQILVLDVGDTVAGRDVFRNQELRLTLPLATPQVLWAGWELRKLHNELAAACPKATIQWKGVDGNHKGVGENVDYMLALLMRVFDVPWAYCGRKTVENLSTSEDEPYLVIAEHSYGHSSYYPNSYAYIRGSWQLLLQEDRKQRHRSYVRRIICGHTHWLNIDYSLGDDRRLDTVGGFQRQERHNLPQVTRPVGMITYWHDGQSITVSKVMPAQDVVDADEENPTLDMENQIAAGQALLQVHDYMESIGISARRQG